ncbi:MAG: porin, partial [Acidithiobacillus sp.]|nr:porin [Acidithiobacillus sp.]
AEYSQVNGYQGVGGLNASDWYVALAANLHQMTLTPSWLDIEPAVRFERFDWNYNGNKAYLNNTTIGVNYSVDPSNPYAARVQLNYVIPTQGSAFRAAYTSGDFGAVPTNGYIYNTLALQFQAGF